MDAVSQLVHTFALQEFYSPLYAAPDTALDRYFYILQLTDFFNPFITKLH